MSREPLKKHEQNAADDEQQDIALKHHELSRRTAIVHPCARWALTHRADLGNHVANRAEFSRFAETRLMTE